MEIKEIKDCLEKLSIEELTDIYSFIDNILKTKKIGDIPIGETFNFFNEEYIVENEHIEGECENCAFDKIGYGEYCKHLCCTRSSRHDKQHVIFVKKINI